MLIGVFNMPYLRNKPMIISLEDIARPVGSELSRTIHAIVDSLAYFFSYRKELRQNGDFERFLNYLDTPSKANAVGMWVFDYTADKEDYWQTAEETFERRDEKGDMIGDCDDLAILNATALDRNGLEAYVLTMWGKDEFGRTMGHATTYLSDSHETIGTFGRITHATTDLARIARYWYPELHGWALYKIKKDGKWERVESGVVKDVENVGMSQVLKEFVDSICRKLDPSFEELVNLSIEINNS